jgi:hypothetical protein
VSRWIIASMRGPMKRAYQIRTKVLGRVSTTPQKIIRPMSIPKMPATPSGPGVGGTAW